MLTDSVVPSPKLVKCGNKLLSEKQVAVAAVYKVFVLFVV